MHVRRNLLTGFDRTVFVLAAICAFLFGCDVSVIPSAAVAPNERPSLSGEFPPVTSPVIEADDDNNSFATAQFATLPTEGEILVEGAIHGAGDIDFFALGPALLGDRMTVEVVGENGLNTVAALFDADMNLIDANDDRSFYAGMLDPFMSLSLRGDTENLYLGIAVSNGRYFASSEGRYDSGRYTIRLRRVPSQFLPPARNQLVYLNFSGGAEVRIASQPVEVMRPFSAEAISGRFSGQSESLARLVVEHMRRDLADFDVTLVSSLDEPAPTDAHTRLFFGNFSADFLGLADNVDVGNLVPDQKAIIFTETLAQWEILQPSMGQIAQAIANVASHELGHLLGLDHTGEAGDVMAVARSAGQMLDNDAIYRRAPLESGVFAMGWQDSYATLMRNVGANPTAGSARVLMSDLMPPAAAAPRDLDLLVNMCERCRDCGE